MPTGYTAAVVDGKVTDFPTFALQCARAFGALITMRDDPMDAPIPDAVEPSTYYERSAATARERLAQLRAMTPEQVEAEYRAECAAVEQRNAEREADAAEKRALIEAMLYEVEQWTPPTSEHVELKNFMCDQLTKTLEYDGRAYRTEPPTIGAEGWYAERVEGLERDIQHYEKEQREENERTAKRNEWVRALRDSLAQPAGRET